MKSESLRKPSEITTAGLDGAGEWVASQSILVYGVRIGIRTNSPKLLDRLAEHFPPLWKPISVSRVDRLFSLRVKSAGLQKRGHSYHELFEDSEPETRSRNLGVVLEDLERRMKMYVAEMARRRVFIHAGAVGWRGKAIIVPGRSLSGKSSLVAELVRAGATYYSDEYAVLDERGRVHPYPQPLAIRRPGSTKQKKYWAEDIGGVTGTRPIPVGLVVVGPYEAGGHWRPRRLSAGLGFLDLLDNALPARRKPNAVISTLHKAISGAVIYKCARGEADETAALILEACDLDQGAH
jgi:hypothetical protein